MWTRICFFPMKGLEGDGQPYFPAESDGEKLKNFPVN
jgi:hypothetical protein